MDSGKIPRTCQLGILVTQSGAAIQKAIQNTTYCTVQEEEEVVVVVTNYGTVHQQTRTNISITPFQPK